jgi:hypothetical protein
MAALAASIRRASFVVALVIIIWELRKSSIRHAINSYSRATLVAVLMALAEPR